MIKSIKYLSPDIDIVEVMVEHGFDMSGVEVPDFDNENEI